MANPVKIFELKGDDFAKGLSYKQNFPIGGIFSQASNFDPFEDYGYYINSLDYAVTDSSLTYTPTVLTSWNDSGTAKIYAHSPTKLYEVLADSPYTSTDKSSQITVTNPVSGAGIYKDKYIYVDNTAGTVRSNSLPVASGSNTTILTGVASSNHYKPLCTAPDKNLYMGDYGQISQITNVTGTSNNTAQFYLLEDTMAVRDLVNDGNYLVAIADNNTSYTTTLSGVRGKYRCQVLFYDVNNGRSTADYIYEFTDSYLISVKQLDGAIYIIGRDNIWVCNSVTPPKSVFNFGTNSTITEPPLNPFQVVKANNSIVWCGQTNSKIYAYGSMVSGQKKVFYQPYSVGHTPSAITHTGTNFFVGTSGANEMLSVLNTGSTRSITSLTTCPIYLPNGYRYAFSKVIMKTKLSTGGQVFLGITSQNNNYEVTDTETKSYSASGNNKQSIIFNKKTDSGNPAQQIFNDFSLTIGSNQAIARVEVWATPIDEHDQTT